MKAQIKITRNKGVGVPIAVHLPRHMFGSVWVKFQDKNRAAIEAAKQHVLSTGEAVAVTDGDKPIDVAGEGGEDFIPCCLKVQNRAFLTLTKSILSYY